MNVLHKNILGFVAREHCNVSFMVKINAIVAVFGHRYNAGVVFKLDLGNFVIFNAEANVKRTPIFSYEGLEFLLVDGLKLRVQCGCLCVGLFPKHLWQVPSEVKFKYCIQKLLYHAHLI